MRKSLKKIKNYLPKTVKLYSQKLNDEQYQQLNELMISYGKCKNMFYQQLCGINNMLTIRKFRKLRNKITKSGLGKIYAERYGFQNKHWRQALFDVCSNLNSMWTNLANQIKHVAQDNDNLSNEQRHYLNFALMFPELWYAILHGYDVYKVKLTKDYMNTFKQIKLSKAKLHQVNNYIKRLTRRYKPYPKVTFNRTMTYEENMYSIKDRQFDFTSTIPRHMFKVTLTSDWHYRKNGDLQIILNRDKKRIEIHKLIKAHHRKLEQKQELGVDKGLATLLSCSSANEYGKDFSSFINEHLNQEAKHLANRQVYLAKRYQLKQKLKHVTNVKKRKSLKRQLAKLNIGSKRYHKWQHRYHENLDSKINHAVNEMLINEQPSLLIKEDLTFTQEKLSKAKNKYEKRARKRLNNWIKGKLNERMEYQCDIYQIKYEDINPAYTSQYCPYCGCKFERRYGKHHELVYCQNCGEMNANIAAGINIKNRYHDKEIKLYTPYKKVKEILDERASTQ